MSRIAISEEDLDGAPEASVVYGSVGGTQHPNVYGPVTGTGPPGRAHGELAVATWVLVTAACVLCVTFGVGGFFAGRAGYVSRSEMKTKQAAERASFDAKLSSAVDDAEVTTRRSLSAQTAERVRKARRSAYKSGKQAGIAEGLARARDERPYGSTYPDSCLNSVVGC
jgi:hypothetical protein